MYNYQLLNDEIKFYSTNTNYVSQQSQDLFSEKYTPQNNSSTNIEGKILILLKYLVIANRII